MVQAGFDDFTYVPSALSPPSLGEVATGRKRSPPTRVILVALVCMALGAVPALGLVVVALNEPGIGAGLMFLIVGPIVLLGGCLAVAGGALGLTGHPNGLPLMAAALVLCGFLGMGLLGSWGFVPAGAAVGASIVLMTRRSRRFFMQ